jgi:hypothetical protein
VLVTVFAACLRRVLVLTCLGMYMAVHTVLGGAEVASTCDAAAMYIQVHRPCLAAIAGRSAAFFVRLKLVPTVVCCSCLADRQGVSCALWWVVVWLVVWYVGWFGIVPGVVGSAVSRSEAILLFACLIDKVVSVSTRAAGAWWWWFFGHLHLQRACTCAVLNRVCTCRLDWNICVLLVW